MKKKRKCYEINLKTYDGSNEIIITVVDDKSEENLETNFMHYTRKLVRDVILSVKQNKVFVMIEGKEHYINYVKLVGKKNRIVPADYLVSDYVLKYAHLRKFESNMLEHREMLLYVPKHNSLECVNTCTGENEYYGMTNYMTVSEYKTFARKFGKPELKIYFESDYSEEGLAFAKNESLLNAYGYSVSAIDDFFTDYRQQLLAEVMDLGLMERYEVLELLEHNIRMHKADKYQKARMKWQTDMAFVRLYNIKKRA